MTTVSFEFFPPKSDTAKDALCEVAQAYKVLNPKFMTVTYGAGGSTRDGTLEMVTRLANETNVPMAAHLTFINTEKQALKDYTDMLWEKNIRHLVALRGDMPDDLQWPLDDDANYFQYTSDFVEALLRWHDFDISVGAYPEKHPDAPSMKDDLIALKKKCDAGATRAITQFFFVNDVYYKFVERLRAMQIHTPIVPGILPIHDYEKMLSFAERCGATVPLWLREKFDRAETGDYGRIAQELLNEQVADLVKQRVPHIHFYTLNKSDMVIEACQNAGLPI